MPFLAAEDKVANNPAAQKLNRAISRHKDFLKRIEQSKGVGDVIFLGDSITHGWEGQKAWQEHCGKTWNLLDRPFCSRSGVAWAKDRWVVVGTSGSDVSLDDGATWRALDRANYNSVAFTSTGEGWAVGPKGRIARFAK